MFANVAGWIAAISFVMETALTGQADTRPSVANYAMLPSFFFIRKLLVFHGL
jgi:hypothetical protein